MLCGAAFFIEKENLRRKFLRRKGGKSSVEGDRGRGNIIIEVKLAKIFTKSVHESTLDKGEQRNELDNSLDEGTNTYNYIRWFELMDFDSISVSF